MLALAAAVIGLYAATARRVARRERDVVPCQRIGQSVEASVVAGRQQLRQSRLSRVPALRRRRRAGLAAIGRRPPSLGQPAHGDDRPRGPDLRPVLRHCGPVHRILGTSGTLAFYTFLLLPTALRFDFRRDFDRLAILKGLPITPAAAVIGQTLAPVLIATLFQALVLAFAIVARSLPPCYLPTAMLVMIPLNVLVFALDNLIYLLYPTACSKRDWRSSFARCSRSPAKGLLFAVALAAVAGWGFDRGGAQPARSRTGPAPASMRT